METEYYRNFITIIEKGNITAAAEHIGIATSALSNQVKNIENEYGAILLKKSRGVQTVQLTEVGQVFYNQMKLFLSMEQNMHQEVNNFSKGYTGKLKLTVSPALSKNLVRNELAAFHERYPAISFRMKESAVAQQENFLKTDIAEIGITNSPLQHAYEFEILMSKKLQYYVIVNPNTKLVDTEKSALTISDLADVPLCLTESSCQDLLTLMANNNISTKILSMFTNRKTSLEWAALDFGVAIYPTYEEDLLDLNYLKCIPLQADELTAKQIVYKLKGKKLSSVAERFLETLEI